MLISIFGFTAAIILSLVGGIRCFLYCYRSCCRGSVSEPGKEYRRVAFMWSVLLFGSMYCYVGTAQNIATVYAPFHGYHPISSPQVLRVILYLLAVAQLFALKSIKKLIQNHSRSKENENSLQGLEVWISTKGILCSLPAIYGLELFLSNGLYGDFYVLVGYSVVLAIALFPRYSEWQSWLANNSKRAQ
ncbi:MAG: hypothetical protein V2B18_24770 [Pseudomonadota bacterium]